MTATGKILSLVEIEDSEIGAVIKEAKRGFKAERIKREVFRNLGPQSPAKNVLVFSTSFSKSFNVWENVKIFAARSLGYARDLGLGPLVAEGLVLRGELEGDRRAPNDDFLSALQTLDSGLEHIRRLGDKELELIARGVFAHLYDQRDRPGVVRRRGMSCSCRNEAGRTRPSRLSRSRTDWGGPFASPRPACC